jgi:hypothetical protein
VKEWLMVATDTSVAVIDGQAWIIIIIIIVVGAAAVLINRNHISNDLYLPIDARPYRLFAAIDGGRTIAEICREEDDPSLARDFFQRLWRWDQVVFDTSCS